MKIQDFSPTNSASRPISPTKLVRLYPSRYYLLAGIALHLFAIFSACVSAIPWWVQGVLLLVVLLSLGLFVREWKNQPVLRVQYQHERWCLFSNISASMKGDEQAPMYKILHWHFWSVWLLILVVEDRKGRQRYIPFLSDCCQPDEFRWFRVIVKYYL